MDEQINIMILCLDDDLEEHIFIHEALKMAGAYNYHLFTDRYNFLKGLTGDIDLCIIDHFLGPTTGLDVLKIVKATNKDSVAIAYTGLKDNTETSKLKTEYINAGIDRWVDKNSHHHIELLTEYLKFGIDVATWRVKLLARFNRMEKKFQ